MWNQHLHFLLLIAGCVVAAGCSSPNQASTAEAKPMTENPSDESIQPAAAESESNTEPSEANYEIATLGAGCFWCVEAVFLELDGVVSVESGYTGGHVVKPNYRQ
ncbi:MAG: peptide-methionine (S)-S-oxide reductase, partial [Planctomycetota bacterium]